MEAVDPVQVYLRLMVAAVFTYLVESMLPPDDSVIEMTAIGGEAGTIGDMRIQVLGILAFCASYVERAGVGLSVAIGASQKAYLQLAVSLLSKFELFSMVHFIYRTGLVAGLEKLFVELDVVAKPCRLGL